MVFISGLMETNMKDNGEKVSNMVKVQINLVMVNAIQENLSMVRQTAKENTNGQVVKYTLETLRMA
jgi:hypothetical protein